MNQDAPSPSPALPDPRQNRGALAIVFLVVFIDLLGFGIVLPLLPVFAKRYLSVWPGDAVAWLQGIILGMLMSSFSAMQFLFAPIWGRASDRIGRRPILLIGLSGSVVFYALFGFASDMPGALAVAALAMLFAARLGAGVAGATIPTAQAVIADCTTPEKRKVGMAMIGAAFGIGFTFGPLIGFGCLSFFPEVPGSLGYTAAGLSLIALLLGLALLRETRRPDNDAVRRRWVNLSEMRQALQTPTVGILVLLFFLTTFGFGSFEPTLSLINKEVLRLANNRNFLVFAYVGLVLLLTQGFLYRRLAKRFSEMVFVRIGICLMALGLAALGAVVFVARLMFQPVTATGGSHFIGQGLAAQILAPITGPAGQAAQLSAAAALAESDGFRQSSPALLAGILVSVSVAVVGFAFLTPSIQALISRRSDPNRQGEILGVNQSASAMARILGPLAGLSLYFANQSRLLPFAFAAILLFAMLPLLSRIQRPDEK